MQANSLDEVVQRLNSMTAGTDQEDQHVDADYLLLDALLLLGQSQIVDAYMAARRRVGFYYV